MVTLKLIDTKAAPQNVCLQLLQLKKNDSKEMGATCKHACFLSLLQIPCLTLHQSIYTVSLKMFAQGGIVTLNSINHLSPLLINANCEKE